MAKSLCTKVALSVVILFACSTIPAFAKGGGAHGGGGGAHGGGGFHGGGYSGGGYHGGGSARGGYSSHAAAGYGAPHSYASRPGGSSYGSSYRSGGSNVAEGRSGYSAPRSGAADGQWHSFGNANGNREGSGSQSASGRSNEGGWQVAGGNRGAGSAGAARTFSGQGHDLYEESPGARNVVSNSQSLSTLHNSFAASSRVGGGSSFLGNRSFSSGANRIGATEPLRSGVNGVGFNRFGFNGFGYGGFGRGCWSCGFGFGRFGYGGFGWGGWGWGWPWLGFGLWDPWYDPWWWGAPPYGYYPYYTPDANVYGYPDPGYSTPDDNSYPPPPQDDQYNQPYSQNDQGAPDGNWVTPNGPNPTVAPNSGNLAVPVLIYMKNGSVMTVRDYWMVDGDLHYILMNGTQRSTNLEQVDLPRTNTENAKSGVKFIFKSEPSVPPSAPDGSAPPAKPNSIQPNGTAPPEAHT